MRVRIALAAYLHNVMLRNRWADRYRSDGNDKHKDTDLARTNQYGSLFLLKPTRITTSPQRDSTGTLRSALLNKQLPPDHP